MLSGLAKVPGARAIWPSRAATGGWPRLLAGQALATARVANLNFAI